MVAGVLGLIAVVVTTVLVVRTTGLRGGLPDRSQFVPSLSRSRRGSAVVCECRRCGTTLDEGTATCPACGSTETARYRLP
jgi:ribosomal protein L37E